MALLEVSQLRFNYSDKELYKDIDLRLNPEDHAVIFGANGTGKTTLLELIVGNLKPDAGTITWEPHVSYSYLDQQLKVGKDQVVLDYLYGVYRALFDKEKRMQELYVEASSGEGDYEKLLEKAMRISDELEQADFYSLQEKVGRLTGGLGFRSEDLEKKLSELSSGQREKAYLAKMLLEEKEVLLMDEPTNFLDATQVTWLANYLNSYPRAFLLVSHDESFLARVANVVFCLENQHLTRYKGDFAHFKAQHEIDAIQYKKDYEAQLRYIKKEEDFIAAHIVRATSAKAAKSRRARLAHLDRMEAPGKGEGKVRFFFPFSHDVGDKPLIVEGLVIGYKRPLLDPISFILKKGEKIAILGKNGIGKTTFVRTILSQIPAISGKYTWLPGIKVAYYSQDEKLDLSLSPFDFIRLHHPELDNTGVRTALGNFGVKKELALRRMDELSGGEVTKTRLAHLSLSKSNVLVFDEPTNHLDQKAKQALFEAIEEYPGVVILVSHEKDFYDGLVDYEIRFS